MKNVYIGAVSVMFAALLWAVDGVVLTPWITRLGVTDVPTFVFMLHATGSVFLSYFLFHKYSELKLLRWRDWGSFILVGLFGGAIGTMAIVAAIIMVYSQGLNISVVLLLQKLQPVFAVLLAIVILKERPRAQFYMWAAVAVIASYVVTFGFVRPDLSMQGMLVPAVLAVLAAFSYGASTVFSKRAITPVGHDIATALRFVITTGIMLVILMVISLGLWAGWETSYLGFVGLSQVSWLSFGVFVLIALTTGGTAIFIYYYGLKRIKASHATIYEMVFPLSSILLEFLIHGNLLSWGQWIGTVVLLGTIIKISRM